jgi:hypothetical protein
MPYYVELIALNFHIYVLLETSILRSRQLSLSTKAVKTAWSNIKSLFTLTDKSALTASIPQDSATTSTIEINSTIHYSFGECSFPQYLVNPASFLSGEKLAPICDLMSPGVAKKSMKNSLLTRYSNFPRPLSISQESQLC